MWQTPERGTENAKIDAAKERPEGHERKARVDIVDLFEELLVRRAEMGYRPLIYVSCERDLECNLIGMFEADASSESNAEAVPTVDSLDELRRRLQ